MNMKNFFITTPIYYVNSKPHIGSVYTTIMTDIINRFKKLNGRNTFFLTGTDEHGMKIQQSAKKAGKKEQEFVDETAKIFEKAAKDMGCEHNDFIRTTDKRHGEFVQEIWKILIKNDWLYKGKYNGWYCVSDEAYYNEDELVKNNGGAFETTLGKAVEWKEEESYFFRLSEFQKILLDIYMNDKKFIQPETRRNEIISFVGGGDLKKILSGEFEVGYLRDLSVSRNNFSWGIKIPCDDKQKPLLKDDEWIDGLQENEKHVVYVWLDALFNYQSAIKDKLDEFWNGAEVVHIVGKDIIKFHTIYWPAFLIAVKYSREEFKKISYRDVVGKGILPTTVFAHGWWTNEGRKISKSFGNIIDPYEEIAWLQKDFDIDNDTALDYFRYYLSTEGVFGGDLDYSRPRFIDKINSELVNNIGNLIQRVLSMVYRDFGGKFETNGFRSLDLSKALDEFNFSGYRDAILQLANDANDYMEKTAPWVLKKDGKIEEMRKVLTSQVNVVIKILILLKPICPHIAKKGLDFLGVERNDLGGFESSIRGIIGEPRGFFPRLAH
jgi:methionyl-tRNA synthetase